MNSQNLKAFNEFFSKTGKERLDGINPLIIEKLSDIEKKYAFDFLIKRIERIASRETVTTLFLLDRERSLKECHNLKNSGTLSEEGLIHFSLEKYRKNNNVEEYTSDLIELLSSPNKDTRNLAINYLPSENINKNNLNKLVECISSEKEDLPYMQGIQKFLEIIGLIYGSNEYKQAYITLRKERDSCKTTMTSLIHDYFGK